MNEVEKMYSNSGIKSKAECTSKVCIVTNPHKDWCNKCESLKHEYPPFTAEKQIELIKWLSQHTFRNYIKFRFDICGLWYCECNMSNSDMHHTFEEALAGTTNSLWQDLTEEEKQQVKGILE